MANKPLPEVTSRPEARMSPQGYGVFEQAGGYRIVFSMGFDRTRRTANSRRSFPCTGNSHPRMRVFISLNEARYLCCFVDLNPIFQRLRFCWHSCLPSTTRTMPCRTRCRIIKH